MLWDAQCRLRRVETDLETMTEDRGREDSLTNRQQLRSAPHARGAGLRRSSPERQCADAKTEHLVPRVAASG